MHDSIAKRLIFILGLHYPFCGYDILLIFDICMWMVVVHNCIYPDVAMLTKNNTWAT